MNDLKRGKAFSGVAKDKGARFRHPTDVCGFTELQNFAGKESGAFMRLWFDFK
ncbi:MAG: hypothetical protein MI862_17225 [Desulfobacterales bacterium]|nr:hypothetical protein [Desulfobacterales bacterium]